MSKLGTVSTIVGALIMSVAGMSVVQAETRICNGTIGKVTLDNIVVQDNGRCFLNGTRLKGNIVVLNRATLTANQVFVNGNIQADGANQVYISPLSVVGGSVQIKQGLRATVDQTRILGDLQLTSNRGYINLTRNKVDGNLQAEQNTGGINISRNVIDEALQCKQNVPAPTGGGNIASIKQDQCARL